MGWDQRCSVIADLLQAAPLWPLDIPLMRTTIPIKAIHRRNGYLSAAARALLILLTEHGS
jgi:hypothetical protein